jgi:hypothetical protein
VAAPVISLLYPCYLPVKRPGSQPAAILTACLSHSMLVPVSTAVIQRAKKTLGHPRKPLLMREEAKVDK